LRGIITHDRTNKHVGIDSDLHSLPAQP
jgi:hypothetical protein